jgi:hypothetical protein
VRLVCQITYKQQTDGSTIWYTNVEDLDDGTKLPICVLVSCEDYQAELNAKQLFKLLSLIAFPNVDLSAWPKTLQ